MRKIYRPLYAIIIPLSFFLFNCEKPNISGNESNRSASESLKKIETAYYEGATKNEVVNSDVKVVTNLSYAQILKEEAAIQENYVKFNSRYNSARDFSGGYDVGVIPSAQGCPLTDQLVRIHIDNEDTNTKTLETGPWNSSWQSDGNTKMYFCKVDGRLLSNSGGTFSVLKLGVNKPQNVVSVTNLFMDCEDHNGNTTFETPGADANPNYVNSDRNLITYWYVFNNENSTAAFPDLGFSYGVLGAPANTLSTSAYYTDDEDGNNKNAISSIEVVGTGDPYRSSDYILTYKQVRATGISFYLGDTANPGDPWGNWGVRAVQGTKFTLAKVK